ncbi:MAG: glycoside-pentoside-hexuronide (GPH):cation symporter [Actinomycetota bacterium]
MSSTSANAPYGTGPAGENQAMKPLPWRAVIGYGFGDAANNVAFTTTSILLLVYYTDVMGVSAAAIGTMLGLVRILDAFFDVLAGRIVDGARVTRWGKFRPFLLFGSIPLLILTFLNFHAPQIGESGIVIYAYFAYAALGLAYSLVNIPFGSLAGAMTQRGEDRAKLASARVVGATLIGSGLTAFVVPLMQPGPELQRVFTVVMTILIVLGFLFYLVCFFTTKERVWRSPEKVSFRDSLRAVSTNKPLLLLMASSVFFLSAYLCLNTAMVYYVRNTLGALNLIPIIAVGQLVLTFVLVAVMPKLVLRFGKKMLYMTLGSLVIVGGVIMWLTPTGTAWLGFTGLLIALAGVLGNNVVVFALEADTVEYGEWKTGQRSEGSIYAVFSFTRKIGQAIGGAIAAWALTLGGYVSGQAEQSSEALRGIATAAGLFPAVLAVIAILIMVKYPLTEKVHTGIMEQIKVRRETGALPVVDAPGTGKE